MSIAAVRGYRKEAVNLEGLRYFDNDEYAETGELQSLYAAREFLQGEIVVAYGDIVFDDFILQNLLAAEGDIRIAVDAAWKLRDRADAKRDLVVTEGTADPLAEQTCRLRAIGGGSRPVRPADATGEWIGLLYLAASKTARVVQLLDELARTEPGTLRTGDLPTLLSRLLAAGETVSVVHSYGHWRDLDDEKDLLAAQNTAAGG
jgi:phosphoenolpyruvate phosphomutase